MLQQYSWQHINDPAKSFGPSRADADVLRPHGYSRANRRPARRSRNILLRSGESQAIDIGEHDEIDKVVVTNLVRDEMAPDIAMKNASA
jgi:hypothetical protein